MSLYKIDTNCKSDFHVDHLYVTFESLLLKGDGMHTNIFRRVTEQEVKDV